MGLRRFSPSCLSQWLPSGPCAHILHRGTRSLNCVRVNKCCTNLALQSRFLCSQFSGSGSHFPWRQNVAGSTKDDPVLHKLFGMIFLRRVFKNYSREEFDVFGFVEGVKIAIQALSDTITSHDREGHMIEMLGYVTRHEVALIYFNRQDKFETNGNHLHDRFHKAFDELKKGGQKAVLEIESSKNFKVTGVRAVCGSADPGDEYHISFLGQKIITSKHDMFELEKRANYAGMSSLFDYGKQLGFSAAEKQFKFQLDVRFSSNERFYIQEDHNGNGEVVFGSRDLVTTTHNMRFETLLGNANSSNDNYPFSWKIVDIDFENDDQHNEW